MDTLVHPRQNLLQMRRLNFKMVPGKEVESIYILQATASGFK